MKYFMHKIYLISIIFLTGSCALLEIGDEGYECKVRFTTVLDLKTAGQSPIPWTTTNGDFLYKDIPFTMTFPENDCENKTFNSYDDLETCTRKVGNILYRSCTVPSDPNSEYVIGTLNSGTVIIPEETEFKMSDSSGNIHNIAFRNGIRKYTLDFDQKILTVDGVFYLKNNEANCVTSNCDAGRK